VAGFFALLDFWGEMFWFEAVGYERRFWTAVFARLIVGAAAGPIATILVALLLLPLSKRPILLGAPNGFLPAVTNDGNP
jgi:hypothetical protein